MADGDAPQETPEQERDRLRTEIAARDAELRGYKATLDALKTREPDPADTRTADSGSGVDPTTGLNPQFVAALRSRGYKDEDIAFNMRVMNDFLPVAAQPFIQVLQAIGDRTDQADFVGDLLVDLLGERSGEVLTVKEEVEKLRKADMAAGRQVRSRKDYGIAVKARRTLAANTPDAFEARVKEEVEKRMHAASGASATQRGAGTSSQNAGPGPAGGIVSGKGGKVYTRDEFDRLPLKEKLEVLGDAAA